jgi:hypothetical protein
MHGPYNIKKLPNFDFSRNISVIKSRNVEGRTCSTVGGYEECVQ